MGQLLFIKRKESTTAVSPLGLKKCLVKENTLGRACFNPSSAFLHFQTSQFGSILSIPVLWFLDHQISPSSPKGIGRFHPNPKSAAFKMAYGTPGCEIQGIWKKSLGAHGLAKPLHKKKQALLVQCIVHISSFLKETCLTSFLGAETKGTWLSKDRS